MFSKKKSSEKVGTMPNPNNINVITKGTLVVGEITSKSDFRIDGELRGKITTEGKIIIRDTGIITGDIKCENSDIYGKVKGNINVSGQLSLKSTAEVEGDITLTKLAIEPGAIFNGSCDMIKTALSDETERQDDTK